MFRARTVKGFSILSTKKVTKIKSLSDIVYLVGVVDQKGLMLFKSKLIVLILCNKIPK